MKKGIAIIGLILIISYAAMFLYNKYSLSELKKKPKMYVYETYMGPANSALIIENIEHKDELVKYYNYAEENKDYTTFDFPLKTLPTGIPVYILEYTDDSLLAKVVSLYYRGPHLGGYTEGYVYCKTLHSLPPPARTPPTQGLGGE